MSDETFIGTAILTILAMIGVSMWYVQFADIDRWHIHTPEAEIVASHISHRSGGTLCFAHGGTDWDGCLAAGEWQTVWRIE